MAYLISALNVNGENIYFTGNEGWSENPHDSWVWPSLEKAEEVSLFLRGQACVSHVRVRSYASILQDSLGAVSSYAGATNSVIRGIPMSNEHRGLLLDTLAEERRARAEEKNQLLSKLQESSP